VNENQPAEGRNQIDERIIWNEYKAGNKQSFSLLYKKYYFLLYNYGFHLVRDKDMVKDCLHELFFYLWENKERITEPHSVKNYLYTAFKRKILDAIKTRERFSSAYLESDFEITISYEQELVTEQTQAEQLHKLQIAIGKLTKRQREAIFLRYFENMNYDEIASIMDCDINSSYVLVARAMQALRHSYCLTTFFAWLTAVKAASIS
jgi:RNA polymerase sigma factor (sigma-70 family)